MNIKNKFIMQEAKPNTKLRDLAIFVLSDKGFAGPNYNLDDISAFVSKEEDYITVKFWDMQTTINKDNKYYNDINNLI